MTQTVQSILTLLDQWAPISTAESWDNSGLQLGELDQKVTKILLSLDIDLNCIQNIIEFKPELVLTHHPIFFKPIKQIEVKSDIGQITSVCIKNHCSVISMHTNLDIAPNGVNDCLIKKFNCNPKKTTPFETYGKYIQTKKTKKELLTCLAAKIRGDETKEIFQNIAFCAGSGHGLIPFLPQHNIDAFITGEVNYHDHIFCQFHNITIFECDHKESEKWVLPQIKQYLQEKTSRLSYKII